MEQIKLSGIYSNTPQAQKDEYMATMRALRAVQEAEKDIYLLFVDGDRKGSIARFIGDKTITLHDSYNRPGVFNTHGHCVWDGRKNKIQWNLTSPYTVWLPDHVGPTVWAKFDAKAAKADLLNNVAEQDIDGKRLAIGDAVIYVNSRYGSGTELCHGVIDRFEAKADSRGHTVFTIVKERGKDVESKIQYPGSYIWKK